MSDHAPLRPGYVSAAVRVLVVCLVFPGVPVGFMIPRLLGQVQRVQDVAWGVALGWAAVVAVVMTGVWWLAGGRARFASFADPFSDGDRGPVVLSGELEWRDLVRALWAQVRPRPLFAVLGALILAMALALPALSLQRNGFSWRDLLALLGIIAFVGHFVLYVPIRLYLRFRRNPLLHGRVSYRVDGDGVRATSSYGQSDLPWEVFQRWRDGSGVAIVYVRGGPAVFVPLRLAASDEDRDLVRQLLRHKLGAAA